MALIKPRIAAGLLAATMALVGSGCAVEQAPADKPEQPRAQDKEKRVAVPVDAEKTPEKGKRVAVPVDAEKTPNKTQAQVARIGKLVKPQPREPRANMARIAWETDAWAAAVKAARGGKPILVFGGHAGVSCGFC